MKRKIAVFALTVVLLASLSVQAVALQETRTIEVTYRSIKITLDGVEIVPTDANGYSVEPFIYSGTTYLPVRGIANALSLGVSWDAATNTVSLTSGGSPVTPLEAAKLSERTASVAATYRDISITIDGIPLIPKDASGNVVEPFIIDGTTYLPVRAISEALELSVSWDDVTSTVSLAKHLERQPNTYEVLRVVDGDTIVVNFNGVEESVRMIGIDTPESVHPDQNKNTEAGKTASEYIKSQLEGQNVQLEFDVQERDHYGRLLAYVWLGDKMFNETLLEEGYATVATYPPNVKYVDRFTAIVDRLNNEDVPEVSPQPSPSPSGSVSAEGGTYIGSIESDKYHYISCRWAEKILPEHEIWFESVAHARATGYQACGVCHPPVKD